MTADRADRLWATHKPQSHDLVAHVDTAEEQPAQIAAVQKKEPAQKKKFAGKKPGERPPVMARWRLLVLVLALDLVA